MTAKSLDKIELERTALHKSFLSLLQTSLREEKLTAEGACNRCFTTQPDEGRRALALNGAASQTAIQLQLLGREIVFQLAFPKQEEQLSLSGGSLRSFSSFQQFIFHKATKKNFA